MEKRGKSLTKTFQTLLVNLEMCVLCLAFATDGFTLFGFMAAPYSCWPVFVKALVWFWLIDKTLSAYLVYQSDYMIGSTTPSGEANEDHDMMMVKPW